MKKIRICLILATLLIISLLVAGCDQAATPTEAPAEVPAEPTSAPVEEPTEEPAVEAQLLSPSPSLLRTSPVSSLERFMAVP